MMNKEFGKNVMVFFVLIGIVVFVELMGVVSAPKCIESGCDNKQAPRSSYCNLHKSAGSRHSDSEDTSYSNKASEDSSYSNKTSEDSYKNNTESTSSYTNTPDTTSPSCNNSTKKDTTTKKNTYDSYDDGYDDIYMDGDYDYDRYYNDSDYADGVDDAMDELEEDW